jgi:hypothetical protein
VPGALHPHLGSAVHLSLSFSKRSPPPWWVSIPLDWD